MISCVDAQRKKNPPRTVKSDLIVVDFPMPPTFYQSIMSRSTFVDLPCLVSAPGTMKKTIKMWLRLGGRMIDAAQNYLNEVRPSAIYLATTKD